MIVVERSRKTKYDLTQNLVKVKVWNKTKFGFDLSSVKPAVVVEWLEQWLCNLQRQQSCLDPGSNPAWDYGIGLV